MKAHLMAFLPFLLAVPVLAQPQIGGGTCSSSTLNGTYSASLTGRDLSAAVAFASSTEAIGSVAFDGLSKVTFTLTTNTVKSFGIAQTLSGTYSLQANCVGILTITSGDSATFTLESYNLGKNYLLTGQDGVYALNGSGGILPANCPTSLTAGSYPVNGNGFGLSSAAISNTFNIIGLIQLSGTNTIALNVNLASSAGAKTISATGTYLLASNCSATASLTDASGITYSLVFQFTAANGNNFIFSSASVQNVFTATGRSL
jgi:hypothetical protein